VWSLGTLAGLGLVAYLDHRFSTVLPMMHLYYLPILLAAVSMGYVGGLVAAGGAVALFEMTHVLIRGEELRLDEAAIVRFVLFMMVGFIAAKLVRDRRRLSEMAQTLQTRNEELIELNRRLERLSEARADFVAVASHEIKTPLTAVIGYAQLLTARSLGDERRMGIAVKLEATTRRLKRTAESLLDATLLELGRLAVRPEPIRLADLLEECGASAGIDGSQRLRVLLPDELRDRIVLADHDRLQEVFVNLVGNALKYSANDGPVTVTAEIRPDCLLIAVSDCGPGIPAQDLPRIFERYYRGPDGRARANGAGLGLSVSREIVRAHGGELSVQSEPGRGSTFTVRLPPSDLEGQTGRAAPLGEHASLAPKVVLPATG
jgi:signal transduction histidine kinase